MPGTAEPLVLPDVSHEEKTDPKEGLEPGYLVICWDDPINLMEYVTHVFQAVITSRHLQSCGFELFDVQVINPHTQRLGAIEIPRAQYLDRLHHAVNLACTF